MFKSVWFAALLATVSVSGYATYQQRAETHRQEGFEAAQAMYDSCVEEAEESQGESERDSNADYIKDCVSSINENDQAGYVVAR